jgi:hypothetical protein
VNGGLNTRWQRFIRRLSQRLSRSAWLARLLQLPDSEGDPDRPGLLLIQVDGLSRPELEHALARGETPFLARLLRREGYRLHSHYSGLPSTTPAVQTELFYGARCAVPAFAFRDHETGEMVRMYEPAAAARREFLHDPDGNRGLLVGGSTYADSITGGAAEAHFCPSAVGWGSALRAANPVVVAAFLVTNLYSFVRVAVLLVLELGLGVYDFFGGLFRGKDIVKELKFIPTRVAISILLRELCVIGGKIDVRRGLPVVHINLLGYDEQAHRRGPRSLFAHWTLKGIDDACARLWRAARGSPWRRYQVWFYSDHGQAAVRAFEERRGYDLEQAVLASLEDLGRDPLAPLARLPESIQTQRVRFLGGRRVQRLFGVLGIGGGEVDEVYPGIAALGPVGHVYLPPGLDRDGRDTVARELATRHGVPVAMTVDGSGAVLAFSGRDAFALPHDAARLFGETHPFVDAIGDDLARLCRHPDAGDIVVLGWRDGVDHLTFATENGAHGGVSPEETHGFALLPGDAPLPPGGPGYLRPDTLGIGARQLLGRADDQGD